MENSLHVTFKPAASGSSDILASVVSWWESEDGGGSEVAMCKEVSASSDGDDDAARSAVVELMLENELDLAIHKFTTCFPGAIAARRATAAEYASVRGADDVDEQTLHLDLGGGDGEGEDGDGDGDGDGDEDEDEEEDGDKDGDEDGDAGRGPKLSIGVTLALCRGVGCGTGSKLWPGGVLLAEWLLTMANNDRNGRGGFLGGRDVVELGAGAGALPAVVAAGACGARRVVATDLGSIVVQLGRNLAENAPGVEARELDWAVAGRQQYAHEKVTIVPHPAAGWSGPGRA